MQPVRQALLATRHHHNAIGVLKTLSGCAWQGQNEMLQA
jgi:hypothetical protein